MKNYALTEGQTIGSMSSKKQDQTFVKPSSPPPAGRKLDKGCCKCNCQPKKKDNV